MEQSTLLKCRRGSKTARCLVPFSRIDTHPALPCLLPYLCGLRTSFSVSPPPHFILPSPACKCVLDTYHVVLDQMIAKLEAATTNPGQQPEPEIDVMCM